MDRLSMINSLIMGQFQQQPINAESAAYYESYQTLVAALAMANLAQPSAPFIAAQQPQLVPMMLPLQPYEIKTEPVDHSSYVEDISAIQQSFQAHNNSSNFYESCADTSLDSSTNGADFTAGLCREIPRHEIECPIDLIVAGLVMDGLKMQGMPVNGADVMAHEEFVKFCLELHSKSLFPIAHVKRSLSKSRRSDIVPRLLTPPLSDDEQEQSAKKARYSLDQQQEQGIPIGYDNEKGSFIFAPVEAKLDTEPAPFEFKEEHNPKLDEYVTKLLQKPFDKPLIAVGPIETIEYNRNMAREYPNARQRTEEQQMRRDKNTVAARVSREKNKQLEELIDGQNAEELSASIDKKRQLAALQVYTLKLMKMAKRDVGKPDEFLKSIGK